MEMTRKRVLAAGLVTVLGVGVAAHERGAYELPTSDEMAGISFTPDIQTIRDIRTAMTPNETAEVAPDNSGPSEPWSQLLATCSGKMIRESYEKTNTFYEDGVSTRFVTNDKLAICGAEDAIVRANEMNDNLESPLFKKGCTGRQTSSGFKPGCLEYCGRAAAMIWGKDSSGYESAIVQYQAMKNSNKLYVDDSPPVGAYVFYDNGGYGHVGVYMGGDKVAGTDIRNLNGEGRISIVPTAEMEDNFGLIYLGWSPGENEMRTVVDPQETPTTPPGSLVVPSEDPYTAESRQNSIQSAAPTARQTPYVVALVKDDGTRDSRSKIRVERQKPGVIDMQTKLNDIGCPELPETGVFGSREYEIVQLFQDNAGLKKDGIPGKKTLGKISISKDTGNKDCGASLPR